jgi:hypothetical protein
MESLEEDENRSPDEDDAEAAARYRSRHSQQPFVKIEGAAHDTAPMSDIRTESTGYVEEDELFSELFGDLDNI